jgi:hypothetical protein
MLPHISLRGFESPWITVAEETSKVIVLSTGVSTAVIIGFGLARPDWKANVEQGSVVSTAMILRQDYTSATSKKKKKKKKKKKEIGQRQRRGGLTTRVPLDHG